MSAQQPRRPAGPPSAEEAFAQAGLALAARRAGPCPGWVAISLETENKYSWSTTIPQALALHDPEAQSPLPPSAETPAPVVTPATTPLPTLAEFVTAHASDTGKACLEALLRNGRDTSTGVHKKLKATGYDVGLDKVKKTLTAMAESGILDNLTDGNPRGYYFSSGFLRLFSGQTQPPATPRGA